MRPLIVANWKMNTTLSDAIVLVNYIKNGFDFSNIEVVLCPPFLWLIPALEIIEKAPKNLSLGAQNVFYEDEGAFTGEISPKMLKGLTEYVIVGHSERRVGGESIEIVNKKVKHVIKNDLKVVLCVGESKKMLLEKRLYGRPTGVDLKNQIFIDILDLLDGVSQEGMNNVVIAYEPLWAIGTGDPATGAYAAAVISGLREVLSQKYSKNVVSDIRILYGGSVTPANAAEFLHQPEIDGLLVGGASLKAKDFLNICQIANSR